MPVQSTKTPNYSREQILPPLEAVNCSKLLTQIWTLMIPPPPLLSGMLTGLIPCKSFTSNHSWYGFMSIVSLSFSGGTMNIQIGKYEFFQPLALTIFHTHFCNSPWALTSGRWNTDDPFVAGHNSNTCSLHFDQCDFLQFSALITIYSTYKLLFIRSDNYTKQRDTNLWKSLML